MSEWDRERMVSASEVERWSYCPLSWKLEREETGAITPELEMGEKRHKKIGEEARSVIGLQESAKQNRNITWTYLIFSIVLLLMGISLVALTRVGSLSIEIWRAGVIVLSVSLIIISLAIYFIRIGAIKEKENGLKNLFPDMDSRRINKTSTPVLFYLYGLVLLVNGILLLRPFGMDPGAISTFMAVSLIIVYVILLVSFTLYFRSHREKVREGEMKLGIPLVLCLIISLSVLFIFISEKVDKDGVMGWIFLLMALLWFIFALAYDWYYKVRSSSRKKEGERDEGSGLPIASLALLASVFTASAFLAQGDNLEDYYFLSVIMAGLWLIGAVFFFWRASTHRRTAELGRRKLNLPRDSRILQVDDLGKNGRKPLVSKKHFLIGLPDMVIEEKDLMIPVEVKTGKIPPKPHFSHIMQIGAYLILMDQKFKQQTPYGYIEYSPDRTHRKRFQIEWDMVTKALVLSKVSEIRDAERTGEAHRNHNREGKCRYCSRRNNCPERLV
ncbi:MAG: PD-(D/E)XK nuclease family protein [Thermoplasmatota archaeon]